MLENQAIAIISQYIAGKGHHGFLKFTSLQEDAKQPKAIWMDEDKSLVLVRMDADMDNGKICEYIPLVKAEGGEISIGEDSLLPYK